MKCFECGSDYIEFFGPLSIQDDVVGEIRVNPVKFYRCQQCGELLLPEETIDIIEQEREKIKDYLIGRLPLDEFITASEAADILKMSRQALHKHPRIRRGFIHSKTHGGRRLYHKKSVEQYKRHKDGRFSLLKAKPQTTATVFSRLAIASDIVDQPITLAKTYRSGKRQLPSHSYGVSTNA